MLSPSIARRRFSSLVLAVLVYGSSPRPSLAEDHISYKWQDYQEDDGRIRVKSQYIGFEKAINDSFVLKGHAVHDAISGATPTGRSEDRDGELPTQTLVETRNAGVIELDWIQGSHTTSIEYALSSENDFRSEGYALKRTSEFNQRNTALSYGVSYIDDDIVARQDRPAERDSYDFFLGLTQNLDRNTVAGLNLTYATAQGYLNDPYRFISKFSELFLFSQTFPESRPESRYRRIVQLNLKRYFDAISASVDTTVRYHDDTWGVRSWTWDLGWFQKIGDYVILNPRFRLYRQTEADFYFYNLDGLDIDPARFETEGPPYYSNDYRLSALDTHTYGLKVIVKPTDSLAIDIAFERYRMEGRDGITSDQAYADAQVLTIGAKWLY